MGAPSYGAAMGLRGTAVKSAVAAALSVSMLVAGAPAASATSFNVAAPVLLNSRAASSQDSNADGTTDIKCATGKYAFAADVVGANWGTYPALEYVRLWCMTATGSQSGTASFGSAPSTALALPAMGDGRCNGATGSLTGVKVNFDRYIKDLKARCGVIVPDSSPTVADAGLQRSWMLDRVENDDFQSDLTCRSGQVLTGFRIRFRRDHDETAFTRLQAWCSTVRPSRR